MSNRVAISRSSSSAGLLAALLTLGSPTVGGQTAPATRAAVDPGVAALIHQLGADDEADRAAAGRQLADLGATAVEPLQSAVADDVDPEVRARAAAALATIAERERTGPTLVTLHVSRADSRYVVAELARQARADLTLTADVDARAPVPVTVDADRRPFWGVFADACGQAGLCPLLESPAHDAIRLAPADRNWFHDAPHQVVGPFWVGVVGVYHLASVDLSGPAVADDQFLARLIVLPEPKLVVTAVSPLAVREAVDDAGRSLLPPAAGLARALARASTTGARLPARTVEARLHYPTTGPSARRIAILAGDLTVTLAQGARRFEADDVLTRPTITSPLPGVRVRVAVAPAADAADTYLVTVECTRPAAADPVTRPSDAQWTAMANRVSDVTVVDAAGHALTPMGWSSDGGNTPATFKATGLYAAAPPTVPPLAAPPRPARARPAGSCGPSVTGFRS